MQIDNLQEAKLINRAVDLLFLTISTELSSNIRLSDSRVSELEQDLDLIARLTPTLTQRIAQLNDIEKSK